MPTRITRDTHVSTGDQSEIVRMVEESFAEEVKDLENSPRMFGLTFESATGRADLYLLSDPTAERVETWEAWLAAMQVGSALFAAATAPADSLVPCRIAEKVRSIPASGPQHFTDAGSWLTAFWLAITCRDQARMTQLAQVPLSLLRDSGASYDEYIYDWVDSLQTYWLETPGLEEKFVRAFNGTDPDAAPIAGRELMLHILYPPLNMFFRFLERDAVAFNEALVQALQLHKKYWTANEERTETTDGTVALGPLAIACLAYDAGMPIDVESEYLPRHILDRTWVGEFDT
ncbi:immunity 49 family protein [Streptomyces sp. AC563]|uniref:immunity 49 family protein n=1 Tax=Streptomyces buecherae TaxID=2763006 RepID=UPI00164D2FE8|nr:immunity 49 family protein [Streptomyces buecherae]MBC3987370.1 immunity 49 family protein [Streptomyces buecherae]